MASTREGLDGTHRPTFEGSVHLDGYADSPRHRSDVIMNSVLYHPHPIRRSTHQEPSHE